jgi:hypothetical protein
MTSIQPSPAWAFAIVRGILSLPSQGRSMTNWPALRFRAMRGAASRMRHTSGESCSFLSIFAMDMPFDTKKPITPACKRQMTGIAFDTPGKKKKRLSELKEPSQSAIKIVPDESATQGTKTSVVLRGLA